MDAKVNVKGLELYELESLVASWGYEKYRARQLMLWLYHKRATAFEQMINLPKVFRAELEERAYISRLKILEKQFSADGDAVKYLFELADGNRIESVLMHDFDRITVCVSSQVGCAQGCSFCATGEIGLLRNMSAVEIVEQFMAIEADLGKPKVATNVVFMGMGEPLANYKQTLKAIKLMIKPEGLTFAARKITISSSGIVPLIRRFTNEGLKVGLAVSLNATTDEMRSRLIPINKYYPIEDLLEATREWAIKTGRRATIEYVLIKDVNDSLEDAHRLCQLLKKVPAKVNLIPFNEIGRIDLKRPDTGQIERFRQILAEAHLVAPVRISKGSDMSAACGQLRAGYERKMIKPE